MSRGNAIILDCINQNPHETTNKMALKTGLDRRTILRHLKDLQTESTIVRVGSNRKGYWVINKKT